MIHTARRLLVLLSPWLLPLSLAAGCTPQATGQQTDGASRDRGREGERERPRLVVLCSIDQLATWVLADASPHLAENGGFRRLQREGVTFSHCAYQHACTETGPGHATIGTGAPAAVHGIVRNSWWSPRDGQLVYCVGEPMEPLPGMPEGRNRGPGRLLSPTLSEVMRAHIPGSKTASVSWKDRSAILMVGRHADSVAWLENSTGNLVTNTVWGAGVPAWISKFNKDRVIDSFFGWQWQRLGPAAAYAGLEDDRPYEVPHGNGSLSRTLPQLLTGGRTAPDIAYYTQVYYSPIGNEIVRLAAQACIDGMALGRDDTPDLLAVSFSSTDLMGHNFGPDSVEARDGVLRLDGQLAEFLRFLDERVGKDRYAFFLTADHGVGPTPEWAKANGIDAGRGLIQTLVRAAAEKALIDRFGAAAEGHRYCVHVGEYALVFDRAAFADADKQCDEAYDIAARAVVKVKGVAAAYTTRDIFSKDPGADPYRIALRAALHPDRAGDVQFVIEPYWLDGVVPASHGTPHAYDREVAAFAMGPGLAAGITIADAVTPGLGVVLFARLLGIGKPTDAVDTLPASLVSGQ